MAVERIAIMAAWNVDSGVFFHAYPLVRAWLDMGYDVRVLSFVPEDFHGRVMFGPDEPFVIRCFGTSGKTNYLDPRPLLTLDYDVLVVEDLKMLPMSRLALIWHHVRRKAKALVHVLHENTIRGRRPPQPPEFYSLDWDAVVYVDERQKWFAEAIYGPRARYIPWPCLPKRGGDKARAREALGLPPDRPIVLCYARGGYQPYLPELPDEELADVLFLILTGREFDWPDYPQVEVRQTGPLRNEEIDLYAFASDAIVLHKAMTPAVPLALISTAVFQFIGTMRPLLVPRIGEAFGVHGPEVLKYSDRGELRALLIDAIRGGPTSKRALEAAQRFLEKHSPEKVAKEFIKLFEELAG